MQIDPVGALIIFALWAAMHFSPLPDAVVYTVTLLAGFACLWWQRRRERHQLQQRINRTWPRKY